LLCLLLRSSSGLGSGVWGQAKKNAKKKVSQVFYESWDTFFVSNVVTFKFLKFLKKDKSIHDFFLFLAFFFLVFLFFPAFFLHFFALQKKGSAPAKKKWAAPSRSAKGKALFSFGKMEQLIFFDRDFFLHFFCTALQKKSGAKKMQKKIRGCSAGREFFGC
jgi:hypothetical protein